MPQNSVQDQIRSSIDQFVVELTQLVRQAALESISQALGGQAAAAPARRGPGRPKGSGRPRKAARARGGRRSSGDVGETAQLLHAHVSSNPGQSISEIASALGSSSKELRLPVLKLIGDGKMHTTGQRRGTRYFAGRGSAAARRGAGKRKGRKKRGARRSAKKA